MRLGNIDKTILIASMPFLGYLMAYQYEKGYLSYFELPEYLIKISVESIILSMTSVLLVLGVLLYIFGSFIYPFLTDWKKSIIGRTFFISFILYFLTAPFILVFGSAHLVDKIFYSILAFILIFSYEFGWPILFLRGKTLEEKLKNQTKSESKLIQLDDELLKDKRAYPYYVLIVSVVFLYLLFGVAGHSRAVNTKEFFTFKNGNNSYAIINIYGREKIGMKINTKKKCLEKEYIILSDTQLITFKKEELRTLLYKRVVEKSDIENFFISIKSRINFIKN